MKQRIKINYRSRELAGRLFLALLALHQFSNLQQKNPAKSKKLSALSRTGSSGERSAPGHASPRRVSESRRA